VNVRQRSLGNTGLPCSELGLGTWGLSGDAYGPVSPDEQNRVIARARLLGVKLFDTADSYGLGEMERRLADVLGVDESLTVVTKIGTNRDVVPAQKCFSREFLEKSLDACASRLRPRALDVVLLHNPSVSTVVSGEATRFLAEQTRIGRIKSWGVSVGSKAVAEAALDAGAPIVELAFNVLWPRELRAIEARAEAAGVGILARSVLAHGLLAGYFPSDKVFPSFDHRSERWTSDELRTRIRELDALRPLVGGDVSSLRAVALRWVLGHSLVSSAILGPRSSLQLDQLVRDAGREPPYLSDEAIKTLESRLEELGARA
jgi:aryl-alcohol dehydrogenase-like predicted oxidoreductase